MPDYRTIITTTGQTKLAAAVLGPALVLQKMAIGDAGGVGYDPAEAQIALVGQVYEANLDSVETLAGGVIVCELTVPADQGGWHVREAAIKDDAGDIIAIARIADRYKPLPASGQADELTIRMKLDVGNVGNVNWVVDLSRKAKIDGQLRPDFRSVEAFLNDPPGAPDPGQTWIVGLAPTGAWVGHENQLAEWSGSGWSFADPTPWMHVGLADRTDWRWDHTLGVPAWVQWLASETMVGPVRKATQAEVDSRTDVDAFLTPKTANETPASSFEYQVSESIPNGVFTVLSNAPAVRHEVLVDAARTDASVTMGALDAGVWQINVSCQVGSACPLSAVILKDGATVAENNVDNGAAVAVSALTRVEAGQVISFQFRQIAGATQQVVTVLSASRFGA